MENEKTMVAMSAEEAEQFAAYKKEQERKRMLEQRKNDMKAYSELVDTAIEEAIPCLMDVSENLKQAKASVMAQFAAALEMKASIFGVRSEQRSHSFTNSDGDKRIILGQYATDDYRDTVNEGIDMVKEYLASLAKDDESKTLVNAILRLLSKDQQGNLKASRVLQLRRMAEESGNDKFIEGVRVIEDSYAPQASRRFIRCEFKDANGKWIPLPLGITEA